MSETAILEPPKVQPNPGKLIMAREDAARALTQQIEIGLQIKAMRIRNGAELDQARAAKLDWTTRTAEWLVQMFDSPAVAEECNDWVGRIYPEYAEFGNFVEQFYAEMDHRLARLKGVLKRVAQAPVPNIKPSIPAAAPAAPAAQALAAPAPQPAPSRPVNGQVLEPTSLINLSALLVVRRVDEACRQAVAEFLESLEIDVSVVEETPDMANMLDRNKAVRFAVVLSSESHNDHLFELGFCAGRLGMQRVILLNTQQVQNQDTRGLPQLSIDPSGGWQLQLARQLRRAGLEIDLNKLC
jgi:hypothetical protein